MDFVKVLVTDDSAFMRRAITKMLENEPDIRVVATARSGEEAIDKNLQFRPDVITMDVEMPGMGGLEAVRHIASTQRTPIIMVSSLTREGADTTFRALELGAVDFIAKPDAMYTNINAVARDLVAKVRTFARRGARPLPSLPPRALIEPRPIAPPPAPPSLSALRGLHNPFECVAIGTSTGGPVALSHVIPRMPEDFPTPVLIVQHMPLGFTRPLADRLNAQSKLHVAEAETGMILQRGSVLVVPSGRQLTLRRSMGEVEVRLRDDDGSSLHVPSVDALAAEVADMYSSAALGVIMTGMGQDGVKGLTRLKASGGYVVGQDEASCVVYGMPRAAAKAGLVDQVVPLSEMATTLYSLTHMAKV